MWNKGVRTLLLISVKTNENFRIKIPIPLFAFTELLDCTRDLLALISVVTPDIEIKIHGKRNKMKNIFKVVDGILIVLESLKFTEPIDFVDVETTDAKVLIKII